MINSPQHYQSKNGVECIQAIEAAVEELTGLEAVCTANVIKYIWRWKKKNGVRESALSVEEKMLIVMILFCEIIHIHIDLHANTAGVIGMRYTR